MSTITKIRCPNCGSFAQRKTIRKKDLIETSCQICDYFLVCTGDRGKVLEAYAPGIDC
ncbi:MAG: replication restart DNA helicase PriA [Prochloraceae cyanobacterium]|nr:replication restart DNA helicase PriA [Prochloraceae cyanobacterium]